MKIFIFIFSIYITALSMLPCSDAITCKSEKSSSSLVDTHDHSEDEEDLCSPFCSCACCGRTCFVITIPQFLKQEVRLYAPQSSIPYFSAFNSSYCHSFWQPPKLS